MSWGWCRGGYASRRRVSCRRGAGQGGNREPDGAADPVSGGRTGGCHSDVDATNAETHDRTDLEQLETDGAASRALLVGAWSFPAYTALYTVILNLVVAVVLTPVMNAISAKHAGSTVAADYYA
jgi:hypothetical protein